MEFEIKRDPDSDFELWILMNVIQEITHAVREKELNRYDISVRQSGILYTIFNQLDNNAKPADIARFSRRGPNSISTILNRMERKGFINKNKDLRKKNAIRVSLTEKGKKALEFANNRRSIHRIFAALSEEELIQAHTLMAKLLDQAVKELKTGG